MATENNVFLLNVAKGSGSEDLWPQVWAMSRAMKKAGWKLLASADSLTKRAINDPALDTWTPTEDLDAAQVWQVDISGGPSYVDQTVAFNDATQSDVDPFPASEAIGDWFAIGFSAPFGVAQIDSTGATQGSIGVIVWEYWNGSAWTALSDVTDDTNSFKAVTGAYTVSWTVPNDWAQNTVNAVAAYYVRARITTVYTVNPTLSQGQVTKPNEDVGTTGTTGSAASIGAVVGGRATVTGLTGMVSASKGRFLLISGASSVINNNMHQIEEVVSTTEVRVDARTFAMVGSDVNNGSISWDEIDPTNETYPTRLDAVTGGWSVWQGPSVLKVPFTSAPVPGTDFDFIRGEKVTQASTGAEGEFLGYVWDDASSGFMTILPQVIGTGGDTPYGWDTANVVTGATSGATVTQVGDALEYRHQCVLAKASTNPDSFGHWYAQAIEPVGESADDFAVLAASAGCTPLVQPGGGGTSNGFPLRAWVVNGGADTTVGQAWHGNNSAHPCGSGQIICRDSLWESGYSADSTVIWAFAHTDGYYGGRAFLRCDDTEPGDLSPFITLGLGQNTLYNTAGRTNAQDSTSVNSTDYLNTVAWDASGTSHSWFKGWRRRGFATDDAYQSFEPLVQYASVSKSDTPALEANPNVADRVATSLVPTKVREPLRIGSVDTTSKMRKGSIRHMTLVQGGIAGQTLDGGKFVQLSSVSGAVVVPWDSTTLPQAT